MSTSANGTLFELPGYFAVREDALFGPTHHLLADGVGGYPEEVGVLTRAVFRLKGDKLSVLSLYAGGVCHEFEVGGPFADIGVEHVPALREFYRALPSDLREVD